MYKYDTDTDKSKPVGISFKLEANFSQKLANLAKESGRTKRMEAKLRLEDHLRRFDQAQEFVDKRKQP
ncbi:TraY domain-containing protein [Thiotrichales bacterium 19S11-10]|nr:TraY domain-containing protein [Thiotrichales bacterium 19S11-10]